MITCHYNNFQQRDPACRNDNAGPIFLDTVKFNRLCTKAKDKNAGLRIPA